MASACWAFKKLPLLELLMPYSVSLGHISIVSMQKSACCKLMEKVNPQSGTIFFHKINFSWIIIFFLKIIKDIFMFLIAYFQFFERFHHLRHLLLLIISCWNWNILEIIVIFLWFCHIFHTVYILYIVHIYIVPHWRAENALKF